MPGDNVNAGGRADHAGGHGQGPALRHPRRRPHGRRRHGDRDYWSKRLAEQTCRARSSHCSAPSARTGTTRPRRTRRPRPSGWNEEVLPALPQAPGAQGNQVELIECGHARSGSCEASIRGVGLTVDQRSPKPRVGVRIPPPLPVPTSGIRHRGANSAMKR